MQLPVQPVAANKVHIFGHKEKFPIFNFLGVFNCFLCHDATVSQAVLQLIFSPRMNIDVARLSAW